MGVECLLIDIHRQFHLRSGYQIVLLKSNNQYRVVILEVRMGKVFD